MKDSRTVGAIAAIVVVALIAWAIGRPYQRAWRGAPLGAGADQSNGERESDRTDKNQMLGGDAPTPSARGSRETPFSDSVEGLRLERWAFTQHQASSPEFAWDAEGLELLSDGGRIRARVSKPVETAHLVYRRRLAGDFSVRLRVKLPARGDVDVRQAGGTAIPYFGLRSLDGTRQFTAPMPPLRDLPGEYELRLDRVGDEVSFFVDGQPRKGLARGRIDAGHLFLQLNSPAKVWIGECEAQAGGKLFDYGMPSFSPVEVGPGRWAYSTGGSNPRDTPDAGNLQLARRDEGLQVTKVDMPGTSCVRHLEEFEGDICLRAELDLPTISESGGYLTKSGLGASIELALRTRNMQTAGVRYRTHLGEKPQRVFVEMQRQGDLIHLVVDGRRVGGYRFPGSQNPAHLQLTIGGVGSVWLRRLERQTPAEPPPGTSLAAAKGQRGEPGTLQPPVAEQPESERIRQAVRMDNQQRPARTANTQGRELEVSTPSRDGDWIDLLAGLDVTQSTLRGKATRRQGAMVIEAPQSAALIRTDSTAPRLFEWRAVVTRLSGTGAFYVVAPVAGRPCAAIVDAERDGVLATGLALIDRLSPRNSAYPATAFRKKLLPVKEKCEIRARVVENQFELFVDEQPVFRWSGDPQRLTLTPFFRTKFPQHFMFGSSNSVFVVHALAFRQLAGNGRPLATGQSAASSPAGNSEASASNPGTDPANAPTAEFEDWSVPSTANRREDEKIRQDLAFARTDDGILVSKTEDSGSFWLLRRPAIEGDFLATVRLLVPPQDGGQISLGAQLEARNGQQFYVPITAPVAGQPREVVVRFQRVGRELIGQVEGKAPHPPANFSGALRLGVKLRKKVRFWIAGVELEALKPAVVGAAREVAVPEEFKLPAPVSNAALGGGGRFLLLHLKPLFKLAVFDIVRKEIVGFIPVSGEGIHFAAGAKHALVIDPSAGTLSRWRLSDLKRDGVRAFAAKYRVADVALGAASDGLLLVASNDQGTNASAIEFFDSRTLEPRPIDVRRGAGPPRPWQDVFAVRASSDGHVFAVATNRGVRILTVAGDRAEDFDDLRTQAKFGIPGPLGQVLFTDKGLLNSQLKPIKQEGLTRLQPTVPATSGPFYLSVDAPISYRVHDSLRGRVSLQVPPLVRPLATWQNLRLLGSRSGYYRRDGSLSLDRRLVFHPPAQRIVAIADEGDHLLIQPVDLKRIAAELEEPPLWVVSQPPSSIRPGTELQYQIEVVGGAGEIAFELTSAPEGMRVSDAGLVTWKVPDGYERASENVIVTIGDREGRKAFHTFQIELQVPPKVPADSSVESGETERPPLSGGKSTPAAGEEVDPSRGSDSPREQLVGPPTRTVSQHTIRLPRPLDDLCLAGRGRYLVCRLATSRQLAVVDLFAAKLDRVLPLDDPQSLFAGSADHIWAVDPESGSVRRWRIGDWEEQPPAQLDAEFRPLAVALGHASQGPLVVAGDDMTALHFYDSASLKPLPINLPRNPHLMGSKSLRLRVSATGNLVTAWKTERSPSGLISVRLFKNAAAVNYLHESVGYVVPSCDGERIYTAAGIYGAQARKLVDESNDSFMPVPAAQGRYFLRVERASLDGSGPASPRVRLFLQGRPHPLATFTDLRVRPAERIDFNAREPLLLDQRIIMVPAASSIATVPDTNDVVIVHRIDLEAAMAASGLDFLAVASSPPTEVQAGAEFSYTLVAKSKRKDLVYQVLDGPQGMIVSHRGEVRWVVPRDQPAEPVAVMLQISANDGQIAYHRFTLAVRPSADRAPEPLRTWTDSSGKFRVQARFVKVNDGMVHVLRRDGSMAVVPLERLSRADQDYVRRQRGSPSSTAASEVDR